MKVWLDSHGYPMVYVGGRKMNEHVYIAEKALGYRLPLGVEVHHFDETPTNNANSNLVICQDRAYHCLLHVRQRIVNAGGDPDRERICPICKALKNLGEFDIIKGKTNLRCKDCRRKIQRKYDAKRRLAGRPKWIQRGQLPV
jgi:hypothetical protein